MSGEAIQVPESSARHRAEADAPDAPSGYKRTECGVIPEDWESSTIRDIASSERNSIVGGPFGSDLVAKDYVERGVPVIRGQNMGGQWVSGAFVFVTPAKATSLAANLAHPGDIVFTQRGTLGQVSLVPNQPFEAYLVSQSQMKLSVNRDLVDPVFLLHVFTSEKQQELIRGRTIQTGVPHINLGILRTIPVQIPTLVEQHAIAEALSDVDGLIGALEKLIAKKQLIKQAAMQQLLTGKTRLPGFSGKWETKTLGNVVERFVGGGTPSRANPAYWGNEIPWVTVKDFATFNPFQAQERITKLGLLNSATNLISAGTLITSTRMALGKAAIYEVDVAINQDLKALILRPDVAVEFLFHWFSHFGESIDSLGSGSTVKGISVNELKRLPISFPAKDEQLAIATVVTDLDTEVTALERRRDKTRQIKQGMMQQLLTGRIRLVKPDIKADEKTVTQSGARQANVQFVRSVLAAEIIDQLHEQPTFGHVKFEKMMFLVERLCEVETGSTYRRKAAGPYDNRALRSIDSQLRAQRWFETRKEGKRYQYVPMQKRGGHKHYFDRYFSGIRETFDRILGAFKALDTERCEIVATLLAAWSDLLRNKGTVSDELIVHEVLNNWHESKRRIPEDRWLKALGWMRSQGFVPKGAT
jgi:type I restriction enzyme S subunit